jgi:DNA gyrase/topoisomerase IV subunit B
VASTRCASARACTPTPPVPTTWPRRSSTTASTRRIAGHARRIEVTLHKDGSVEVSDDGRGMPVDIHPEQGISRGRGHPHQAARRRQVLQQELPFSGGLHGVGVSVVNALSQRLEVWVKRGGAEYNMAFAGGEKASNWRRSARSASRTPAPGCASGPTRLFRLAEIFVPSLRHVLRAKAVLCPGLTHPLRDEASGEREEWCYQDGCARTTCWRHWHGAETARDEPFVGSMQGTNEAAELGAGVAAGGGRAGRGELREPDPHAPGRHPRQRPAHRLTEAVREFCEFRNLLPRGSSWRRGCLGPVQLHPVGEAEDPQFSGQTKERLSSRECAAFVSGCGQGRLQPVAQPAHRDGRAHRRAGHRRAPRRACAAGARWCARRSPGPGPARQARRLHQHDPGAHRAVPGRGRLRRRLGQAGARPRVPGHHAAARQDPEHLGGRPQRCWPRRRCTTSRWPSASIPGSATT